MVSAPQEAERNIADIENINILTGDNKLLKERNELLEKQLEEMKDYEKIKKDLMVAEEKNIDFDKENEILITELEQKDIELEEALIKIEMFNLEIEEQYINDEDEIIPNHKDAYQKLKKKMKVYFEITSEEKFEMENKIERLNNKLQELQTQKANVMESLEVQQEIKKRDNDISELMKIIDSYKESSKMIEKMTDKNSKLEDVISKFTNDLEAEKIKNVHLEEEIEAEKLYNEELEETMKDLEEEVKIYEEMQGEWDKEKTDLEAEIAEYKELNELLEMEKKELEGENFESSNEKDLYVNYLKDANKQSIGAAESLKSQILKKYEANYWLFKAEQRKVLIEGLPEKIQNKMNIEKLKNYENFELNDLRVNGCVELLIKDYLLKASLKEDSPNLYFNARDLVLDLLNIKSYLSFCKKKLRENEETPESPNPEEGNEEQNEAQNTNFLESEFYKEVLKNLINIENLYLILTKGELSSNYCMSHFAEAKFKLEEMMNEFDKNNKIRILRVLSKALQQMSVYASEGGDKMDNQTRDLLHKIIENILYIFENFDKFNEFHADNERKLETYENILKLSISPDQYNSANMSMMEEERIDNIINVKLLDAVIDNMSDFLLWSEKLISEINEKNPDFKAKKFEVYKGTERYDLREGTAWTPEIEEIKKELVKVDEYRELADSLQNEIVQNSNKLKEYEKSSDIAKKYKMSAEEKIRNLQMKANKLPSMELEVKNLNDKLIRLEKSRTMLTDKLKQKEKSDLKEKSMVNVSINRAQNDSFSNLNRDPSMSLEKQNNYNKVNTFKNINEQNINVEYDLKTKTQINSLKGLVKFLNKELISQKSKNLNFRLYNFKQKSKTFTKLSKIYNKGVKLSTASDEPEEAKLNPVKKSSLVNPLANILNSDIYQSTNKLEMLVEESENESIEESNFIFINF